MGTVTFTDVQRVSEGGRNRACLATLTMSSSYATGGDSLNAEYQLPFTDVENISFFELDSQSSHFFQFDEVSKKILAFQTNSAGGGNTGNASAGTPGGTISAPSLASTPIVVEGPTLRLYIFGASGAFQVGETVTGGTSGSTAVVDSVTADYLVVSGVAVNIFSATETITGSVTGVTATVLGSVCYAWDISGNSIVNQSIFTFRALGGSDFDLIQVSPFDIAYVDLFGSLSGNFVMHDYANEVVLGPTFSLSTLYNECLFVALASTTSVPVFAGDPLATHNHTVAVGGGSLTEVVNGTDLSSVSLRCKIWGRM